MLNLTIMVMIKIDIFVFPRRTSTGLMLLSHHVNTAVICPCEGRKAITPLECGKHGQYEDIDCMLHLSATDDFVLFFFQTTYIRS